MKISKFIQKIVNMTIILIIPSKIGGFIVGLLSGYLILFVVLINLNIFLQNSELFNESKVASFIINDTPILSNTCSNYRNTINNIYMLGNDIAKDKITNIEANSIAIDEMLKNKIVSKDLIIDLIRVNKIKDSVYLKNILNKY